MAVTIKLMMIILLWNNDGSFESNVSEVTECPDTEIVRAVMEERRVAGLVKSWAAYCEAVQFGHDTTI